MPRRARLSNLADSLDSNEVRSPEIRVKTRGFTLETRNLSLNFHSGSDSKGEMTFKKLRGIVDEEKRKGRKSPRFLNSQEQLEPSEDGEDRVMRDDELSLR